MKSLIGLGKSSLLGKTACFDNIALFSQTFIQTCQIVSFIRSSLCWHLPCTRMCTNADPPVWVESHPLHESNVLGILVVAVTSHLLAKLLFYKTMQNNAKQCKTMQQNALLCTIHCIPPLPMIRRQCFPAGQWKCPRCFFLYPPHWLLPLPFIFVFVKVELKVEFLLVGGESMGDTFSFPSCWFLPELSI